MTITFVATKNRQLRPNVHLETIWDAKEPSNMVMATEAFLSHVMGPQNGQEEETATPPKKQRCVGTAGMKCAHRGLIGTALQAYNKHHKLVIRPDDVWCTILAQFCAYVNAHVDTVGKRLWQKTSGNSSRPSLNVTLPHGESSDSTMPHASFVQGLIQEIGQHLAGQDEQDPEDLQDSEKTDMNDLFLPSFSTTTPVDQVCALVAAVGTTANQLSYNLETQCGIPQITLVGTVQDWIDLRHDKLEHLVHAFSKDCDESFLQEWIPTLRFVCDNLVESAQHGSQHNLEFWHNMVRSENASSSHGDGTNRGAACGPSITGWLMIFSYFDSHGHVHEEIVQARRQEDKDDESSQDFVTRMIRDNQWPRISIAQTSSNNISCPLIIRHGPSDNNDGEDKFDVQESNLYKAHLFVGQMSFDVQCDPDAPDSSHAFSQGLTRDEQQGRLRFVPRNDWALLVRCDPEPQDA